MIISHQHRFIFIKTYKTAGTSLEVFLSQHVGPDAVVTPIIPAVEPHQPRNHTGRWNLLYELWERPVPRRTSVRAWSRRERYYNHIPARVAMCRVPAHIWGYFKFTIERNPWDKTLSHYHMLNHRAGGTLTFDAYLAGNDFAHNLPQYAHAGRLLVDRVLKYENLTDELRLIFARARIPFTGDLGVRAKGEYRSDRRPYQEVYTPAQRDRVAQLFAAEIALHGYTF